MKLGGGGGEAYLKLKRYERVVFYRFSKRGYALYKAGRRGGRAIKSAGKLCPVLCMFGFNCSVPNKHEVAPSCRICLNYSCHAREKSLDLAGRATLAQLYY